MEAICKTCNKLIKVTPSRAKQKNVFCSRKCLYANPDKTTTKIPLSCKECHTTFYTYPSRINEKKYCSQRCYDLNRAVNTISCMTCKKPCKDFRGKRKRKYCSLECAYKKKAPRGKNHYKYSTGIGKFKKTVATNKNKYCELCGSTKNIELHHIDGDRTNNSKTNWLQLCCICHNRIHHIPQHTNISVVDALELYRSNKLYRLNTKEYARYWQIKL